MKQIINTVLFGRRKSYIFGALLTVIGLYIGFLFWYLIANNWVRPTINILVLIICILVAGNVLLALYKIPEQLCSNPNIEHLLNFPIKVSQIIYAVIFRLCKVQVLIYICFFIPYILFFNDKIALTISYGLICILLSMIFDCLIFVLMIGIPFISKKFCGYTILVIQYGGFLLIIGLGAYSFIEYLANPLLLWNISNWIQSYYMILFPILLLILFLGYARELDPQKRPCTLVSVQGTTADTDCSAQLSDVICLNRYYGWYFGGPDLEVSETGLRKELSDWGKLGKPVMFTEYGADTVSGLHDTTSVMYTEEYQVEYYEMNNKVFDEFDFVVGEQAWNFADFATSQSLLRVQGNKKGLFTRDRKPKMVAHYFRNRWSAIPEFGYKTK